MSSRIWRSTPEQGSREHQENAVKRAILTFLLSATVIYTLAAQTTTPQQGSESARSFVQQFYSWYVPISRGHNNESAWDIALRQKPDDFTPELTTALKVDSEAQAKADEIVGLDFDPFENGQDPCERYVAEQSVGKSGAYWVNVYGVCEGKKHIEPDVIAEVKQVQGRWVFVNFHYLPKGDLLEVLNILAKERQTPGK